MKKILVIYKKSSLQLAKEQKNKKILELLESGDESVANYQSTHDAHVATLKTLKQELSNSCFAQVDFRYRANAEKINSYDLVMTVGGDGTFLWASKLVGSRTPILGINSAPESSVGFYTYTNRDGISKLVSDLCHDVEFSCKKVNRLQIHVNGKQVQDKILNDVLFAASHPAAMTRYILQAPNNNDTTTSTEEQRSSGIWISTPCGSTGANLSAGGWPLPFDDARGQYVIREPMKNYVWGTEHKLIHGFFKKAQEIKIICKARKAVLACDGTTITLPVTTGDRISISHSKETLTILGK